MSTSNQFPTTEQPQTSRLENDAQPIQNLEQPVQRTESNTQSLKTTESHQSQHTGYENTTSIDEDGEKYAGANGDKDAGIFTLHNHHEHEEPRKVHETGANCDDEDHHHYAGAVGGKSQKKPFTIGGH
ncbi:unnamed protein product [Ambrosiozyma monospora]|uniref:Unnamed protein product n=1 Tax=Ambrosiozyma monospora TaxID=43982 RepID=A0ACB5TBX7_AMBMO|nr:unnamed protein product [Ambrosiozyma monospora]